MNPNDLGGGFRCWEDRNGNGIAELDELGPPTRPFGGRVNKIDPALKRPYSDEFNVRVDHQLVADLSISVAYYRLEAMVDVFNLLNQDARTVINTTVGPLLGQPIAILPPRVARLGLPLVF